MAMFKLPLWITEAKQASEKQPMPMGALAQVEA